MLSKSCIFNNVLETHLESEETNTNLPHMNLMMLDDSQKDITLLDDILSNSNVSYDLNSFTNYNHFVNAVALSENKPDLLIVDVNMPEINGIDALKKIKNINLLKDIPIIIHSSSREHEHWLNAGKFKADAFFHKPLSIEQFSEFVISSPLFHK